MGPSPALAVDSGEQPDDALIQQVLGGNTALFELLMRRYNERVYRAARAIVRDEQEAEDVMQQAMSTRSRICASSTAPRASPPG